MTDLGDKYDLAITKCNEKRDSSSKPTNKDPMSASVVSAYNEIDPMVEKRVRRKLDMHMMPLLAALYLLSVLDRSNIG